MSLLPASGFQSVQFRMIEIYATPLCNLVNEQNRKSFSEKEPLEDTYEHLYWKFGATETETGEKTLTLKQFEYRYTPRLMRTAHQVQKSSLYHSYNNLPIEEKNNDVLIKAMRTFDKNVNVNWGLVHMKAAYRYLNKKGDQEVKATGGTNWKQFLPPSFQKISFFPSLWNEEELENWGKKWVEDLVNSSNK